MREGLKWVLALASAVTILIGLSACGPDRDTAVSATRLPSGISRFHDDEKGVTCWLYDWVRAGGLSCITDRELAANWPYGGTGK